ncbi:hypothetical protein CCR75_005644 [Bremia lactucae]|uniref:Uncharacterized protein n=1 Tax=Bremia lactucae TaxID=4779 RepID=A0A976FNQ5_BRELC|nr:hypothetical protein CCR75_005644 [Bremia lactucae]
MIRVKDNVGLPSPPPLLPQTSPPVLSPSRPCLAWVRWVHPSFSVWAAPESLSPWLWIWSSRLPPLLSMDAYQPPSSVERRSPFCRVGRA